MRPPCPCKNKDHSASSASVDETNEKPTNPLACPDCLDKHLGAAAEYAKESEEDATRFEEYRRSLGHMVCAEDHARALGLFDYASRIRAARKTFQTTRKAYDMEALLKEDTSK